jgi:hypothetical protein
MKPTSPPPSAAALSYAIVVIGGFAIMDETVRAFTHSDLNARVSPKLIAELHQSAHQRTIAQFLAALPSNQAKKRGRKASSPSELICRMN